MKDFTLRKRFLDCKSGTSSLFKGFVMLVVLMLMTTSSAMAQEPKFEVIDGFRYLLDSGTKTATLVPPKDGDYSGDIIIIPEKVKGNDGVEYVVTSFGASCFKDCRGLTSITIPSSVTSLGDGCFQDCSGLTSITIPSSVTSLGDFCFQGCSGLISITIPSSVTSLGGNCFLNCQKLETVYFEGKYCRSNYANLKIPTTSIIKVPTEYLQGYKDSFGSAYKYIYAWNPDGSGDDTKPVTQCATPSVSYGEGKLMFACETTGAKYHYTITDTDIKSDAQSENGEVSLSAAYNISVYATADGYKASDKAEATLYWVNANLDTGTNINMVKTRGVVASAHDGIITLSGLDNGEVVKFYATDGKYLGSMVAANGAASYAVNESLVIAKVGKDSIKIAMK